jgi:hypothetical protein
MADATRRSSRFSMRSKQLGQLLLENGDVQAEQVAQALKIQEQQGGMLGQILRADGAITDIAIAQALLKQVQVTDIKCEELAVDPAVAQLVDREICETEKLCPFERLGNLLCVVMGNPLNRRAITAIEERTHLKVKSFKSVWPKISELIQRTYDAVPAEGDAGQEAVADQGDAIQLEGDQPALNLEDAQAPMEIPVEEPVSGQRRANRQDQVPAARSDPKIQGIDNLTDENAELIETNRRGLTKRGKGGPSVPEEDAPRPKVDKKAKVNVDLDALDLSAGEVVKDKFVTQIDEANLEEISESAPVTKALARHADEIVQFKAIRDGYFYNDGKTPRDRSDELSALLDTLPIATVIAESIGDYEEKLKESAPKPKPVEKPVLKASSPAQAAAIASRPLELQPVPGGAVTAILISEAEFERHIASLGEDPVGEWDWNYAAPGPVPVQAYEEN